MQLGEVIERLNQFASGEASWEPLAGVLPEARRRIAWLQDQYRRIPNPLTVLLFGGTGTGKSTLLNALAGAEIARMGDMRPTTEIPTVYHPTGAPKEFGEAVYVEDARLENIVLIDTPDTDSIRSEHARRVGPMLERADVVLFCGTQQKYANETSVAMLRRVMNERKIVLVQTHADTAPDIREDWLRRMEEEGFRIAQTFRVCALNALRAKLDGKTPDENSIEFAALEEYITRKLPPERRSVKEQNLAGALSNTVDALSRALDAKRKTLEAASERLTSIEHEIASKSIANIQRELLDEPHVWVTALADAVGERAFGLIGTLYRILHGLRVMPSRITRTLSPAGLLRPSAPAASLDVSERYLRSLASSFAGEHAEAGAHLARAGFVPEPFELWKKDFIAELGGHLDTSLAPARERLVARAKTLTKWTLPALELLWAAPLLLTIGFPVFRYYEALATSMDVVLPETGFLSRALGMLAFVIFIETSAYAFLVRWTGRSLRRKCARGLSKEIATSCFGFSKSKEEIAKTMEKLAELDQVWENVL
jgi:predicted GTPase